MDFDWKIFLCAAGLALLYESVPYLLFPKKMQQIMRRISEENPDMVQRVGLCSLMMGVILIWLALG